MSCKQKATRIIKHSLSCPSEQTDTRRPLKQDGPAPDTFSDSVHRLCNDHRYMDSNINKIMVNVWLRFGYELVSCYDNTVW